jgi:hypothetical protein
MVKGPKVTAYWLMFLIPIVALYSPIKAEVVFRQVLILLLGLLFVIFIGFRHEVGGDWIPYLEVFSEVQFIAINFNFDKIISIAFNNDFGYVMLNYYVYLLDADIYLVNLICALIFIYGVWRFSFLQNNPWLSIIISLPFLTYIVAMGYTRQSVSVGFIFAAVANLQQGRKTWFWVDVLLAVIFYKLSVLFLFIGIFQSSKFSYSFKVTFSLIVAIIAALVMRENIDFWIYSYITNQHMTSHGAIPRVLLNLIPALIFLLYKDKLCFHENVKNLFFIMSLSILVTAPFVFWFSTPIDRLQIFLMPVQLAVFSNLSYLVKQVYLKQAIVFSIVVGYTTVFFIWFNFAKTVRKWIPYDNLLSMSLG